MEGWGTFGDRRVGGELGMGIDVDGWVVDGSVGDESVGDGSVGDGSVGESWGW